MTIIRASEATITVTIDGKKISGSMLGLMSIRPEEPIWMEEVARAAAATEPGVGYLGLALALAGAAATSHTSTRLFQDCVHLAIHADRFLFVDGLVWRRPRGYSASFTCHRIPQLWETPWPIQFERLMGERHRRVRLARERRTVSALRRQARRRGRRLSRRLNRERT